MQSPSFSSCKKSFLAPSAGAITGHFPQISLHEAGSHAFFTASGVPAGFALVLMHCIQSLHHRLIFGLPAASRPSVQSTSVGLYGVRSGVSSGPAEPAATDELNSTKDKVFCILNTMYTTMKQMANSCARA